MTAYVPKKKNKVKGFPLFSPWDFFPYCPFPGLKRKEDGMKVGVTGV